MPTSHYKWGFKMPTKKTKTEPKERHTVGPHGEKRPLSPISNAVRVMEIATGLREEEYADGSLGPHARRGDD